MGQPDRRDSLGVCVEQQNGCDSLQRDKAVCISTNGEWIVSWRMWYFVFPKTCGPWLLTSLDHIWATSSSSYVRIACAVKIFGEILDQLFLLAVTETCLMWQKGTGQGYFPFLLACKNQGDTVLHVSVCTKGAIMFAIWTVSGAVFVNGKEMTNQLPAVTSGSTVTFDMEVVHLGTSSNEGGNFKLRVTISSNNREVVFDWVLDQCCGSLYFGCSFSYPGWKVLVF